MEPTRLRGPGSLLGALPALLGFRPKESVVVVSLRKGGEVGIVLRVDRQDCVSPGIVCHLAHSITQHLLRDRAKAVVLVSYTDDDVRLDCPAMEGLRPVISEVVDDVETWAVVRGRYFSPGCVRESCCPVGGRPVPVPPVPSRPVRAAMPSHGVAGSSPGAAFTVNEAARRRVARAGDRWREGRSKDVVDWRKRSFALWVEAVKGMGRDRYPTEVEAGRLVEALQDRRIRDAVLVSLMPDSDSVAVGVLDGSADGEVSQVLEVLLSPEHGRPPRSGIIAPVWGLLGYLTAHARTQRRAPALTLCAILSWWEGDDEACRSLLAQAHEAEPGYRLAGLLECTVLAGIDPGWKRAA